MYWVGWIRINGMNHAYQRARNITTTVDGWLSGVHQLIWRISHYLQVFVHSGGARFLPSTVLYVFYMNLYETRKSMNIPKHPFHRCYAKELHCIGNGHPSCNENPRSGYDNTLLVSDWWTSLGIVKTYQCWIGRANHFSFKYANSLVSSICLKDRLKIVGGRWSNWKKSVEQTLAMEHPHNFSQVIYGNLVGNHIL